MASGANFLQSLGWNREERWGREVQLPDDFAYLETGLRNSAPLSDWSDLGVRRADGSELPIADVEGSILVPAGHEGPAFLVYDNFSVIMRWNRSESYAISVGHLADRILGGGGLISPPSEDQLALTRSQLLGLQNALVEQGYDPGTPDGVMGPATRGALSAFQRDSGLIADGFPNQASIDRLGLQLP